jgi:hypothetical protein
MTGKATNLRHDHDEFGFDCTERAVCPESADLWRKIKIIMVVPLCWRWLPFGRRLRRQPLTPAGATADANAATPPLPVLDILVYVSLARTCAE